MSVAIAVRNPVRTGLSEAEYSASQAWGMSLHLDLHDCDPGLIRSAEAIQRFTEELCDMIEVKRFGPTQIVRFGRDPLVYGYSMVQLIETSLVSGHFAEDSNAVYLDIFSCKYYDPQVVASYAETFFRSGSGHAIVTLRA
jgi:S-adenosylmethionine/arginine decarboxylase-like enzyme